MNIVKLLRDLAFVIMCGAAGTLFGIIVGAALLSPIAPPILIIGLFGTGFGAFGILTGYTLIK